ncbi:MAG TPA: proton-conducting transporter membrane subunit [Aggregatilinea sp.]|uniref:NADH-quinone oxidoreductase subunit 5 family protein n=1 Tax=Aggregatilinea sp. TaxID=2806333 RepID=UPI002C04216A|nr:proton-conducting transporter membrane subunit [Aggregatilinea sp.]HML24505.1 proton-conducting transporter membrane subunit [Aggregatilinea sp.]
MTDWLIVLTIGLPWLGALAVWLTGDDRPDQQHRLAVIFSVLAGITALLLIPSTSDSVALRIDVGSVFGDFTFVPDGLGVFLAAVATVVGCLAVVFAVDYMDGEKQLGRFYSFVLLFIGAMVGLVLTGSILLLFIFWEITALTSYALISFHNDDPKAVAGGIKALVMTSFGGVGMLIGGLIVYAYLGDYQISTLLSRADELPSGVLAALAFGFLIAAAAKSAQVPFHTWLPGAMEAPTPVSALIHAATMVNGGVYVLARFYPAFEGVNGWTTAVTVVGLVSALMAALMALVATDLKRVLAYSTVSQLGYMVYAIGVGDIFASQFHLLSHAVFKALLFLSAGAVIHSVGTRDMREMGGLGKQMPFVRNVFVVGSLALAGLPILNGFWSKELILEGGLHDGPVWAYIGMVIGAGITALYTFRMVWLVFYSEPRAKLHVHPAGQMMRLSTGILAAGTATTWLLIGLFGELLEDTLPFHHLHVEAGTTLLGDVLTAPATYLALGVVALGLLAWWFRDLLSGVAASLRPIGDAAAADFGFEWLNRRVALWVTTAGESLRTFQTGSVNWNVAGIVGALIVVLVILALGA